MAATPPATLYTIVGIFAIADGREEPVPNKSYPIHVYNSVLEAEDNSKIKVHIHNFGPSLLANFTNVLLIGKVIFPLDPSIVPTIISYKLAPFPGNPSARGYDDYIPSFGPPFIMATGHVSSPVRSTGSEPRSFSMTASTWNNGAPHASSVMCILKNNACWPRAPPLPLRSPLSVVGPACGIIDKHILAISLADTATNLAHLDPILAQRASLGGQPRRKFLAHLKDDEPSSSTPTNVSPVASTSQVPLISSQIDLPPTSSPTFTPNNVPDHSQSDVLPYVTPIKKPRRKPLTKAEKAAAAAAAAIMNTTDPLDPSLFPPPAAPKTPRRKAPAKSVPTLPLMDPVAASPPQQMESPRKRRKQSNP
ncbi:hypothetical protein CPB83DRAFT_910689 [Crepidotus variabilis]|uniref:Uncharacterized protein n=1 Tax=Crepidotus variabilis TaxID=179855 RepID=A0A9P6E6J8_9AGAR|nr:hypothetical protein CPB83DRAFT_910689 [Crepidotus variabilis]